MSNTCPGISCLSLLTGKPMYEVKRSFVGGHDVGISDAIDYLEDNGFSCSYEGLYFRSGRNYLIHTYLGYLIVLDKDQMVHDYLIGHPVSRYLYHSRLQSGYWVEKDDGVGSFLARKPIQRVGSASEAIVA